MMYQFVDSHNGKAISERITLEEARDFALDYLAKEVGKYANPLATYDERFSDLLNASVLAFEVNEGNSELLSLAMRKLDWTLERFNGVKLTIHDKNETIEYSCDEGLYCLENIKRKIIEYISNCIVWDFDSDETDIDEYRIEVEFMCEVVNCTSMYLLKEILMERPNIVLEDE